MLSIDLQNDNGFSGIPEKQDFERWVSAALLSKFDQLEQSIRIVDLDESRSLNAKFRNIDKPTNILSFPMEDDAFLPYQCLGDLVICQPVVLQESDDQQKALLAHWAHLVIHGMLHLQGFDHIDDRDAKLMEAEEIKILSTLGFSNPYNADLNQ